MCFQTAPTLNTNKPPLICVSVFEIMKTVALLLSIAVVGLSRNDDRFNYRETVGRDFGPMDWNRVTCDNVDRCVSAWSRNISVFASPCCHCTCVLTFSCLAWIPGRLDAWSWLATGSKQLSLVSQWVKSLRSSSPISHRSEAKQRNPKPHFRERVYRFALDEVRRFQLHVGHARKPERVLD